jgi:methyl-accepting chemotaxis protein
MGENTRIKDNNRVAFWKTWNQKNIMIEQREKKNEEPLYEIKEDPDTQIVVVESVKKDLSSISTTANSIDLATEEMAKCTVVQANEIQDVNSKITKMGNVVDNTFGSVDVLANGYDRIIKYGTQGNIMLAELIDISKETQKSIDAVRRQIEATNISTAEISKATASIKGIAYQTNLLSLNASIEAARSGESGRGFAVVANEIRKLADQSQNIAVQITRIVNILIENSNSSVEIMTKVTESIKSQDDKLNSTNEVFEGLVSEMSGVSGAIEDVTLAMVELEELKNEVVGSVCNLTTLSEENAASSEEISASIQEMNQNITNCIKII